MNLLGQQCRSCGHRNPRDAKFCRVTYRVAYGPNWSDWSVGFRVVRFADD